MNEYRLLTQTQSSNLLAMVCMITNYPIVVLNTDISNILADEVLQYFNAGTFSCQVQGSHLMERKKVSKKLNLPAKKFGVQTKYKPPISKNTISALNCIALLIFLVTGHRLVSQSCPWIRPQIVHV